MEDIRERGDSRNLEKQREKARREKTESVRLKKAEKQRLRKSDKRVRKIYGGLREKQ